MLRHRWMAIHTPAGRAFPAPRPRTTLIQMERCHILQVRTPLIVNDRLMNELHWHEPT